MWDLHGERGTEVEQGAESFSGTFAAMIVERARAGRIRTLRKA